MLYLCVVNFLLCLCPYPIFQIKKLCSLILFLYFVLDLEYKRPVDTAAAEESRALYSTGPDQCQTHV